MKSMFMRFLVLGILSSATTACGPMPSSEGTAPPAPRKFATDSEAISCETNGPLQPVANADGLFPLSIIPPRAGHFCALILPIDARSLSALLKGEKSIDYRRSHPSDGISHILYFNTRTQALEAIAEVEQSFGGDPLHIAEVTLPRSGANGSGNYFAGRPYGFAIALASIAPLKSPITIAQARDIDEKFQRPYGYIFLDRHPALNAEVLERMTRFVSE